MLCPPVWCKCCAWVSLLQHVGVFPESWQQFYGGSEVQNYKYKTYYLTCHNTELHYRNTFTTCKTNLHFRIHFNQTQNTLTSTDANLQVVKMFFTKNNLGEGESQIRVCGPSDNRGWSSSVAKVDGEPRWKATKFFFCPFGGEHKSQLTLIWMACGCNLFRYL